MNKYHKIQDNSQIKSTLFRVDKSTHAEHFFFYTLTYPIYNVLLLIHRCYGIIHNCCFFFFFSWDAGHSAIFFHRPFAKFRSTLIQMWSF